MYVYLYLFSFALGASANSLVVNERLVTKVYFPRIVLPLASVVAGLVDFALAFVFLVGLMYYYGVTLTAAILTLPLFVLMTVVAATSVGILLSAVNVQFRDVRYVIPFLTQFWLFATPIAYPSSLLPEPWRTVYGLNPMVGVVEGFRWALLGTQTAPGLTVAISAVVSLTLLTSGFFYFKRMEKTFADTV